MPALVAASAAAFELAGDAGRAAFRYQRDAVLDGEWWRLITGNLVHLGPRHLALNLAGLALVVVVAGRSLEGWRGASVMAVAMATVGGGLLWLAPDVAWYVGLSGALHGLLACIALDALLDRSERVWGALLLAVLAAKLCWEQAVGPLPSTAAVAGGPVIVVAHLHGTLGGAVAALLSHASWRRSDGRPRNGPQV